MRLIKGAERWTEKKDSNNLKHKVVFFSTLQLNRKLIRKANKKVSKDFFFLANFTQQQSKQKLLEI